MIPDLETSDVKLKGLPTKVHRDPFHQHLILREDRVATVAGFAVASTTPNLFDAVVRQAPVLEFAPDEKTERFPVEERTLLFIYCRDNQVAECIRCTARFHLREVASLDSFGIRTYVCGWCHTDLTNSIRAHLYGCAMLPVAIRRRMAQAPREAAPPVA